MEQQKLGITNFAYGTGPYLRTTELLIAFNDELKRRGHTRLSFVVPWIYGDKQRRIMLEEFEGHTKEHPEEILLDAKLGILLKGIFYGDNTYEDALGKWVANHDSVSDSIKSHLSGSFEVETLGGKKLAVNGRNIVLELNRSPRVLYEVAPTYSTTFGHIADILEGLRDVNIQHIAVDRELAREGLKLAERIERAQGMHAVAYPATFSGMRDYEPRYPNSQLVPPITSLPHGDISEELDNGIFVTVTGISGLERLYEEARALGIKLYSNAPEAVPGSERQLPHVISNETILFQFARAGWGSVWLSMLSNTPVVVPEFDPLDDPEIYFNNKVIEELGIGIVYRGQSLQEILNARNAVQDRCRSMREELMRRWGTLTSNRVCAKMFVDDFLK